MREHEWEIKSPENGFNEAEAPAWLKQQEEKMDKKDILASYGIIAGCETVREYAGIEVIENGGIDRAAQDVIGAIEAENFTETGRTLNPWFNDAQVAVIQSYMDGRFAADLLASEKRPNVYARDALLAYLVAACDPELGNAHDNLCGILDAVNEPLPESEIRNRFPEAGPYIWDSRPQNGAFLAVSRPFAEKAMEAFEEIAGDPDIRDCDVHRGFPDGSILFQFGRGIPRSGKLFATLEGVLKKIGAEEKDYMLEISAVNESFPEFRGRLKSSASPKPRYEIDTEFENDPEPGSGYGTANPFRKLARALAANFDQDQIVKWAKKAVPDMKQKSPKP